MPYYIMDGRAHEDIDSAIVLCTCDTLSEAIDDIDGWGNASVIIDEQGHLVYSMMQDWNEDGVWQDRREQLKEELWREGE